MLTVNILITSGLPRKGGRAGAHSQRPMANSRSQQVSDQSTNDVRPQRRQIIVSGLPLKSWRSWHWGQTAYVVTTSIPFPPRVGRRTPVRTTTLQCVGASGRMRTSCRLSRTRSSRTDTTRWPSPVSSTTCACRSEEHTSELQSQFHLVCRLLLEKKKNSGRRRNRHVCRSACGESGRRASAGRKYCRSHL